MRKTEKFYENFNKLKVSPEQAAERFEFKDVKTLDGLAAQASSLTDKVNKTHSAYIDADMKAEEAGDAENAAGDEIEDQKDKFQKIRDENNKREDAQDKVIAKAKAQYDKIAEKAQKAIDKWTKSMGVARDAQREAKILVDKLKSNIQTFESSAKALGVDVSSKIEKYKSAMRKLDASTQKKIN